MPYLPIEDRIDWTHAQHDALMRRIARGEKPRITLYDGTVARVTGTSRWDEGLCVSQDGYAFMYRAGVYGINHA